MGATVTDTLHAKIEEALNQIRPFLKEDGGDVRLVEVTPEGKALVEFQGACRSCNMSSMTFSGGVRETILREVPEVSAVEEVAPEA